MLNLFLEKGNFVEECSSEMKKIRIDNFKSLGLVLGKVFSINPIYYPLPSKKFFTVRSLCIPALINVN